MTPSGQTICLCMIVNDEAAVIRRCLASVRPIIDHWLIIDTGSTDGTQDFVRVALADIPGTLFDRPRLDFAKIRSEALALSKPHGTYSLIIDAHDELEIPPDFSMPDLEADAYSVEIRNGDVNCRRNQLVSNALTWRYEGMLHECLRCEDAHVFGYLPLVIHHDIARKRTPEAYRERAAALDIARGTEADAELVARYTLDLAQSYRDCGEFVRAIDVYLERAGMGLSDQEVFLSFYQAAKLMEVLGHSSEDILTVYQRATDVCPSRAEAAYRASRLCRFTGQNERGHAIARPAIGLAVPTDGLLVEHWIYQYGILDEFAVNAYWAGYYRECLDASLRALASGQVSPGEQPRFVQNARFALEKLDKAKSLSMLPQTVGAIALAPRFSSTRLSSAAPRVLLAVLAKQKETVLRLYLECLEALDYPKSSIVLYIRTNNNKDQTRNILSTWIQGVSRDYAHVEFDDRDVPEPVESFAVHEWNATRFKVLAAIRNVSLRKTSEHGCAFYFVPDVDNFLMPATLRELVALDLPIVAPMLRHINPSSHYSNYHAAIDAQGYFSRSPTYDLILSRQVVGLIEVPVVHCTYLIRGDVVAHLRYDDDSDRHEYVVFSDQARSRGIPQYIDNRREYGVLTLDDDNPELSVEQVAAIKTIMSGAR